MRRRVARKMTTTPASSQATTEKTRRLGVPSTAMPTVGLTHRRPSRCRKIVFADALLEDPAPVDDREEPKQNSSARRKR